MKKLHFLGASVLAASMGFAVTTPLSAAEVAVSLSAMFPDGGQTAASQVNTAGGVLTAPLEIENLSVSAGVGTDNAMAGGFTDASSASSIAGAGITTGELGPTGVTFTGK